MLWTELAAGASRQRANGCAEAYFTEARWRGTCLRELRRARYANGARPKRGHRGLCTCARTELLRARVVGFCASHAKVGHPRRRAALEPPARVLGVGRSQRPAQVHSRARAQAAGSGERGGAEGAQPASRAQALPCRAGLPYAACRVDALFAPRCAVREATLGGVGGARRLPRSGCVADALSCRVAGCLCHPLARAACARDAPRPWCGCASCRPLAHRCERRARECRGAGRAWDAETFEALGVVATGHWRHNAAEADARAAGFSRDAARARTACEAAERAALQQRARKHAALFHKELARQEYMHSIFAW